MRIVLAAALVVAMSAFAPRTANSGPYEDCILQNMKGVQAQAAAGAIMRACKDKTTPKRCRRAAIQEQIAGMGLWEKFDAAGARKAGYSDDEISAYLTESCLKECATASYWSRTFGECSTD